MIIIKNSYYKYSESVENEVVAVIKWPINTNYQRIITALGK